MNLLLTNDDGIQAQGLEILRQSAISFGEVTMVAPKFEQSGVSHRLSFDRPVPIEKIGSNRYQVDGTPGDCVRVAIATLDTKFDWVLSGVNDGANLGVEIYYSGTIAAAREATMLGIPAIALSQYRRKYSASFNWEGQVGGVSQVLEKLLSDNHSQGELVNVNFPDAEAAENRIVECQADMTPLPNSYAETEGGYELSFKYNNRDRQSGMDVDVCFSGNISITRHTL